MKKLLAWRREWPLALSLATFGLFFAFGADWLGDLSDRAWYAFVFLWLVSVILASTFAVVRHADALAARLGEPLGTLVLTLAVTGIEVMIIAASMASGQGSPTLARDAMFAVVMIVLNGMIGLSLLLGGLRYHEQTYNLQGASAFLAMILPLAVLGLILPTFTETTPGPIFSPVQAGFLSFMSISLYCVFLAVQNFRHRDWFVTDGGEPPESAAPHSTETSAWHAGFLVAYLLPMVLLCKQLAVPIDHGISVLGAPAALGGFLVAVLVLSPESVTAVRAALANQLQRSVNLLLGSVVATIALTIPAVLMIGLATGKGIVLGLDAQGIILLSLTLVLSMLTFSSSRTNVLLGAVHLLLFFSYLLLIFQR